MAPKIVSESEMLGDQRHSDGSANDDIAEQWQSNVTHIAPQMRGKGRLSASLQRAPDAALRPALPWKALIGALKSQVRAQGALRACYVALYPARSVDAKLELGPLFSPMVYFFFCRRQSAVFP